MAIGENEQGLHKILDISRFISIIVLILHFYYYCYQAFNHWGMASLFSDRILENIKKQDYLINS